MKWWEKESGSLTDRLRYSADECEYTKRSRVLREAADEIERLRYENSELIHDIERAIKNHIADLTSE